MNGKENPCLNTKAPSISSLGDEDETAAIRRMTTTHGSTADIASRLGSVRLPLKADKAQTCWHVRVVPTTDMCAAAKRLWGWTCQRRCLRARSGDLARAWCRDRAVRIAHSFPGSTVNGSGSA